jgi:hypothetical protein
MMMQHYDCRLSWIPSQADFAGTDIHNREVVRSALEDVDGRRTMTLGDEGQGARR